MKTKKITVALGLSVLAAPAFVKPLELNENGTDDFADFCKKKKQASRSAAYYVDKDLIKTARANGCTTFADSVEKFLEERGELTKKQRVALTKWDGNGGFYYDYEDDFGDDGEDHWDGPQLSFGDIC